MAQFYVDPSRVFDLEDPARRARLAKDGSTVSLPVDGTALRFVDVVEVRSQRVKRAVFSVGGFSTDTAGGLEMVPVDLSFHRCTGCVYDSDPWFTRKAFLRSSAANPLVDDRSGVLADVPFGGCDGILVRVRRVVPGTLWTDGTNPITFRIYVRAREDDGGAFGGLCFGPALG